MHLSEEMRSWKQRSLAAASRSSHLAVFKAQLSQHDFRTPCPSPGLLQPEPEPEPGESSDTTKQQSWSQWVGRKLARRGDSYDSTGSNGVDMITLFPGWATRRYQKAGGSAGAGVEDSFGVDVFISGYASNCRPPGLATRSQRAFLRLAKGFASLPKLQASHQASGSDQPPIPLSRSTEELLASIQLPPRPTEITDNYESKQIEALEEKFRNLQTPDDSEISSISRSSSSSDLTATPQPSTTTTVPLPADLYKMHANLESRLRPFWSTTLSSRTIRLSLFASPQDPALSASAQSKEYEKTGLDHGPIAVQDVVTGSDGSFQAKFIVPWDDIREHPGASHIAKGDPTHEHKLLIIAEMPPAPTSQASQSRTIRRRTPSPSRVAQTAEHISLTYSPVRVISDIDDTIKLSNIPSGARTVFHNVFVKELREIVIPGMGEWYNEMWARGVRFHYVSNGPFELIPVVNEFFEVSNIPPGSVRLKSYAGRSLFNGLLSAPATRKRAGILDILDHFPESGFILIGDTGEQDLELYATIAKERPQQILAVFVRDVERDAQDLDDPTGANVSIPSPASSPGSSKTMDTTFKQAIRPKIPVSRGSLPNPWTRQTSLEPLSPQRSLSELAATLKARPKPVRTLSKLSLSSVNNGNFFTGPRSSSPTRGMLDSDGEGSSSASSSASMSARAYLSEQEKKRAELQMRVYRARVQIPVHIPLRIFRKPEECVEASEMLNSTLHAGRT